MFSETTNPTERIIVAGSHRDTSTSVHPRRAELSASNPSSQRRFHDPAGPATGQTARGDEMERDDSDGTIYIRPARNADAQGIAGRQATFETVLRTADDILSAMAAGGKRYPWIVAVLDGEIVGWASVSTYRPRPCYAGIGEFSIYVDERARGQGVGKVLLPALISAAEEAGFWKLLSRVFPTNTASRKLAAACGFREVGLYEKHAKLDGRWIDVVIIERLIEANLT